MIQKQIAVKKSMKHHTFILLVSILFAIFLWILGAVLDSAIFYDLNFLQSMVTDIPLHELMVRLIGAFLCLFFGFIANRIVDSKQKLIYKLEESQENLTITLNSIGDAVLVTDDKGMITKLNPIAEQLTGWKGSQAIGRHVDEVFRIVNEYTRQKADNPVHKVIRDGCIIGLANHTALISKDGKEFSIADSGAPIKDSTGSIIGCILVFRDVTEERIAHKQILDNEEKFSRIFSMSPDAIVITRLSDGVILDMNDSYCRIFGFEKKELIGRSTKEINIWGESYSRNQFVNALTHNELVKDLEVGMIKKDGSPVTLSVSAAIIESSGEKAVISYSRDITERKNYETRLIQYQNELEKGIKERTIELEQINENLKTEIFERSRIESALRQSEETHRTLIEQVPVGLYRTTPDGRFLQANPALATILGFSSVEELMEASVFNFFEKPLHRSILIDNLKNKTDLVEEEIELIRNDNKKIIVRDFGKLIYKDQAHTEIDSIDGILIDITESKKAEEALEESERRYRQIFENLNDIYFNLSDKGEILVISPSISKAMGYTQPELIGRNINDMIDDRQVTDRFLSMIKRLGRMNNFLLPVRKKDGSLLYLSANVRLRVDRARKVVGVEGIARDITNEINHKRLTSALYSISKAVNSTDSLDELYSSIRSSLSEIIDTNNFFIALCDRDKGKISFPYFVDEIDKDIPEIDIDSSTSLTARVINTGQPLLMDQNDLAERYKTSEPLGSMSKIWLAVPLKVGESVIGAIGLQSYSNPDLYNIEDVALLQSVSNQVAVAIDRKRAIISLNFQLDFLQNLIDTIPNPIFYKDVTLKYLTVNKAFEDSLGMKKENIIGKNAFDIFPYDQAKVLNEFDKALLKDYKTQVIETVEKSLAGEERNLLNYKTCFRDEKDHVAGIVGIKIDITERKKAEEEMKIALSKEQELNELKSRFIAMVSHEYRTPLTAIILSTELLSDYGDRLSEDNKAKHFHRIRQSVHTMNSLLDDIILYNKIEVGKTDFNPQYIDLEQVCLSLTHEMQFIAKDKTIIDLTIAGGNVIAYLDEKIIRQVVVNLLSNAIKYSNEGSIIEFDVIVNHEDLEFIIKDKGIGIPEEEQPRLFEPFYRGRNIGTISGTGLGLSIVKNSVEIHKGSISYISKEGLGTTFFIRLPFLKECFVKEKVYENPDNEATIKH